MFEIKSDFNIAYSYRERGAAKAPHLCGRVWSIVIYYLKLIKTKLPVGVQEPGAITPHVEKWGLNRENNYPPTAPP